MCEKLKITYDVYCTFKTRMISSSIGEFEDTIKELLGANEPTPYCRTSNVQCFSLESSRDLTVLELKKLKGYIEESFSKFDLRVESIRPRI